MTDIHGPAGGPDGAMPLKPEDKKAYEAEYRQGLDLFKRAMTEYGNADEIHKKEAFKEVMERALQVLNETARELKRPDLMTQNQQIAHDLETYENAGDKDSKSQLAQDIKQAKKTIG
jgi:hypothetical protein